MSEEKKDEKERTRVPDIAARRRRDKSGQLQHNPEQPAEEGEPVNPVPQRSPEGRTDGRTESNKD